MIIFLLNILFAVLAYLLVRYLAPRVVPEGQDKDKIVTIVAIISAILIFFANLAQYIVK